MADIRIKDLATTASTTASDDFLAVDGTTNGTRKLSAATPSFATSVTVPGVVGPTSTDLTLTGGSTGASLVLGQGASGAVTITPKGTGALVLNPAASSQITFFNGATLRGGIGFDDGGSLITGATAGSLGFRTQSTPLNISTNGGSSIVAQITSTGNLLIGTTTDMTGSGGLKIAGTTAATSTTSGALIVAGGIGVSGAGYFGGNVNAGGTLTTGGNIGAGGAVSTQIGLNVASSSLIGSAQFGIASQPTFSSAATTGITSGYFKVTTAAAAFTSSVGYAMQLVAPTIGSGSAITTNTGLYVENQGAAGITNAYGIDIAAQSGAATTNIGLRNAGITSLTSTTPSTGVGTGALQVAGGIYAGAASVFGGAATFAGAVTASGAVTGGIARATSWSLDNSLAYFGHSSAAGAAGTYAMLQSAAGNTQLNGASTLTLNISNSPQLSLASGTATFAGAVSIGNTVGTAAAVASTHKVTMVIGGVTYYLLATNV